MGRIGVAIGGALDQRHVGLLFRAGSRDIQFLHLAWHHHLKCGRPDPGYGWVACPSFDDEEANMFATWALAVYNANVGSMPYGLNYALGSQFDDAGKFIASTDGEGLTCATFLMALFRSFGYDAVEEQSWVNRESDRAFHEKIVTALRSAPSADPQHVAAQERHIGTAPRFRPEEVAVALNAYVDDPICFADAEPLGKTVINILWVRGKIK
ncbi:hypothetical protein [Paraburkholderia megapolitana]|nr:hypothetical protein [Paraburkholderia megapolitana]